MKIALFGKRSFLSLALKKYLESIFVDVVIISSDQITFDNSDSIQKILEEIKVDYAFNCIAMANVDAAEKDKELASLLNKTLTKNFAIACHKVGVKGVHFSTDYVFDGSKNEPYTELDNPNPISVYGKTKLDGEIAFLQNHSNGLICRISWLFGSGKFNYIDKFIEDIIADKGFNVIKDQIGSPSYTDDIAKFSFLLKDCNGILHLANNGFATKKQCAEFISQELNKKKWHFDQKKIMPVLLSDLNLQAKRPKFSALNCDKVEDILKMSIPSYREGIIKYMNCYLKEKCYE